ncbi:hypothetical protein BDZ97DRAFT_1925610 [Flammula alnicola]|nr:hypothetical protein BDZ97DRAFT_1925610 [Flammula alnicola]
MPVIPLDVVGVIFNILARDDKELISLKGCSLTCKAFLFLCRRHIFASIKINDLYTLVRKRQPSPRTNMLRKLLTTAPHIADYIHELHFGVSNDDLEFFIGLPEILKRLTSLRALILSHYGAVQLDWKRMTPLLEDALLCLLNLPTLTSLKLRDIKNFPASALIPCTQLRHLALVEVDFLDAVKIDDNPPALLPVGPILLEGCTLRGSSTAAAVKKILEAKRSDGRYIFDFEHLSEFSADWAVDNMAQNVMRRNHYLTTIHLSVVDDASFSGFARAVAPSINTLKKLILDTSINNEAEDPLFGLCDELEEMGGENVLEDMTIRVHVPSGRYCTTGDEWGKLDNVLGKSGWSALKRVSLDIGLWRFGTGPDHKPSWGP